MLPKENREEASAYISWVSSKYEDVVAYEPAGDQNIIDNFMKNHKEYKSNELPDMVINLYGGKINSGNNIQLTAVTIEIPLPKTKTSPSGISRTLKDIKNNPVGIDTYSNDIMKKEIARRAILNGTDSGYKNSSHSIEEEKKESPIPSREDK